MRSVALRWVFWGFCFAWVGSPLAVHAAPDAAGRVRPFRALWKAEPYDATLLRSGRLLLSYGSRLDQFGAGVVLSSDGGKTWDDEHRVLIGWDSLNTDTGYPSTLQLDDGTIVTMYYAVGTAACPDTQAIVVRYTEGQLLEAMKAPPRLAGKPAEARPVEPNPADKAAAPPQKPAPGGTGVSPVPCSGPEKVVGVWHRSGCPRRVAPGGKTVYGGPHATYCAWTRPMAVYVASQDKTFFVFGNSENSPTISSYDHRQQRFSPAVVLGRNRDMDAHRNPHLLVDEKGFLYVFFGSHCTPTYLVKSVRPYDIADWSPMGIVAENTSYPQPWQLQSGEIVVLFRQGATHNAGEAAVRSCDGGKTWSAPTLIAASPPKNGLYAVSIAAQGAYPRRVHMAWSVTRGDWWQRYHVYYAYSDDGARTWKRSDGRAYRLPIPEADAEMVFRSEVPDRGVWLQDIQLDSQGSPYVLFVDGHTLTYDCTWRLARCLDGKWTVQPVAPADHMYDGGALVLLSDDDFRAYLPSTPSQAYEDGGDIDEWKSTDRGQTWTKSRAITSGSKYSHNHVKGVFGQQRGDFRVFWSYGDSRDPPETRAVDLYYYGEQFGQARRIPLVYDPQRRRGPQQSKQGVPR